MADARCSCGFAEAGDETITDHLLAVFTPPDGVGADGRVHEEWTVPLTCSCGFAAGIAAELDAHFLAFFTPADSVARDGRRHEPANVSGARYRRDS